MKIEYMFIGKKSEDRIPQKKDITKSLEKCFDNVTKNSFTIKPKRKTYTINYCVNSCASEGANEKFPVYDVVVMIDTEENFKCAELLDIVNSIISTCSDIRKNYNIVITLNEMSGYYAKKIYPSFFSFESKLRCLVYKILIKIFGCKWIDATMQQQFYEQMQKKIAIEEGSNSHARIIEKALDEMTYYELEAFLFSENREIDADEFLHTLENKEDLDEMTKEELINFVTSNQKKSIWDKYFKDKVLIDDLKDKLEILRIERNKVAHCKKFTKEDYDKAQELLKELIEKLDLALVENAIIEPDSNTFEDVVKTFFGLLFVGAIVTVKAMGGLAGAVKAITEMSKTIEKVKPIKITEGMSQTIKTFSEISKVAGVVPQPKFSTEEIKKLSTPRNLGFK